MWVAACWGRSQTACLASENREGEEKMRTKEKLWLQARVTDSEPANGELVGLTILNIDTGHPKVDHASLQTTVRVDPNFATWYFSQDCFDGVINFTVLWDTW